MGTGVGVSVGISVGARVGALVFVAIATCVGVRISTGACEDEAQADKIITMNEISKRFKYNLLRPVYW